MLAVGFNPDLYTQREVCETYAEMPVSDLLSQRDN
jgi:hypothetical protein